MPPVCETCAKSAKRLQASDKIIGGTSATPMGVPWQVLLSKLERPDIFVNWQNPFDWNWNSTNPFDPCNWPNPFNPCNWPNPIDLITNLVNFTFPFTPPEPNLNRYSPTFGQRLHVLCAGVLINGDWVLTAASCTYKYLDTII